MKNFLFSICSAAICGGLTFAAVFLLIPSVAVGVPDFLWIAANIIIACGAAFLIFEKLLPADPIYILGSAFFQYLLLFIFSDTAAKILGFNPDSALGGFELIGFAFPWIIGTTAAQHITLLIYRKLFKGKEPLR